MRNFEVVHLHWREKEWDLEEMNSAYNTEEDYGIYQIYGDHPVYGENTLLYIGRARGITYSTRMIKHGQDFFDKCHISCFRKLHLSYFLKSEDVSKEKWETYIDFVENLLIYSHFPAYNSVSIKNPKLKLPYGNEVLVINWDERGKLLPEVSSMKYSYRYGDIGNNEYLKKN